MAVPGRKSAAWEGSASGGPRTPGVKVDGMAFGARGTAEDGPEAGNLTSSWRLGCLRGGGGN